MKRIRQYKTPAVTICVDETESQIYMVRIQSEDREHCITGLGREVALCVFHEELSKVLVDNVECTA